MNWQRGVEAAFLPSLVAVVNRVAAAAWAVAVCLWRIILFPKLCCDVRRRHWNMLPLAGIVRSFVRSFRRSVDRSAEEVDR